ncbi:MAG: hypothetical protein N3D10_03690 [Candidatus Micrarchaeota archaeon]|nr:hypothetical protein [Candidatus Micrarchaeota archaeon]
MKLVYVLLFVLSIELFFSYAQLYSWQDEKTAPIECVKKCKASEFNVSIIQKNRIFYLS